MTDSPELPGVLGDIRSDFLALGVKDRLQLLLEFSRSLPELPPRLAMRADLLEPVPECQAPISVFTELDAGRVHFFATAPLSAPTSRGFAAILAEGLDGLSAEEVLAIPVDYPMTLGLAEAVSPLRLRGMTALLGRAQRQVRTAAAQAS